MNGDIKKILIVLGLYALADGIFYNFEELWLASNNLSINTVSIILSLGALISVSVIFLSSNIIKPKSIKKLILSLLIIRCLIFLTLFILNGTNMHFLIKLLIMFEYAIDVEIITSIYPLMSLINKGNKLYALKGLIYDLLYYIGVIIVGFFLGKSIGDIQITFNLYILLSLIVLIPAIILLQSIDIRKYIKDNKNEEKYLLFKLLDNIKKDKISLLYFGFLFFGQVSYYTCIGIMLTILVNNFSLDPSLASNIKLILGIMSAVLGFVILYKLTLKKDYINVSIKYIGRIITYLSVIVYPSVITLWIAIIYTGLTSSCYVHITDAPYINRYKSNDQFAFANLKEMVGYLSRSIGTYLCGLCFAINFIINFWISAICSTVCIIFLFLAIYYSNKEKMVNYNDWK